MEASPALNRTKAIQHNTTVPVPVPESEPEPTAMEQREVNRLLEQHVGDGREVLADLISDYDPASLTSVDLTEFTGRLAQVRQKLADVRKNIRIVMKELRGPENDENLGALEEMIKKAALDVKDHEARVKAKIETLRGAVTEAKSPESVKLNPASGKNFAINVLESINEQAEFLVIKLNEVVGVDSKPDNEKRDICSKRDTHQEDMFKIKIAFSKAKADIYKEGLDDDSLIEVEDLMGNLKEKLQKIELDCNRTVNYLRKIDEKDELYSTSKVSPVTPYPTPKFSGAPGQNLVVWLEKMYKAIQDNQIRKNKQVSVLRDNLEGQAKKLVSENVTDWTEAKKLLLDAHGNPKLLWMDLYTKARTKLTPWRDKYSDKNLTGTDFALEGIRVLQEFLREADLMSTTDSNIQLQFENEFDSLCGLCPIAWTRRLLKLKGPHDEKLKKFHELLNDEYQILTRLKINYQKDGAVSSKKDSSGEPGGNPNKRKDAKALIAKSDSCWSCKSPSDKDDHSMLKEIGMAGCRKFLIKKAGERMKIIKDENICRRCMRHKFNKSKICFANSKEGVKKFYICTEDKCNINAILCADHGQHNVSEEFQKKLDVVFGKTFENRVAICTDDVHPFTSGTLKVSSTSIDSHGELNEEFVNTVTIEIPAALDLLTSQAKKHGEQSGFIPSQILNIPPGDPLFCFVLVEGRTRDHIAFQDTGASAALAAKKPISDGEFNYVTLHKDAVNLNLAGGVTMTTRGEVLLAMPLADGRAQAIKATIVDKITDTFPKIETSNAVKNLIKKAKTDATIPSETVQEIARADIIKVTGGDITFLVGQKYAVCSPELVYQDPMTGMGLFKSKYRSKSGRQQYCLAGPIQGLKYLSHGKNCHFYNFIQQINNCAIVSMFAPKMDNFPGKANRDLDEDVSDEENEEMLNLHIQDLNQEVLPIWAESSEEGRMRCCRCSLDETDEEENGQYVHRTCQEEKEINKFHEAESLGLGISYRCPKCRACSDCQKGDIFEEISVKEEAEQHEISNSLRIDPEQRRMIAKLPFRTDPEVALKENRKVAEACLNRVCSKYDEKVKETIVKAIMKLHTNGHLLFEHEYSSEIAEAVKSKIGHFICYDVAFSTSLSTPVRPVYNASKNTPGGTNLNDCLYRGTPYLTNMLGVMFDWTMENYAFIGDIGQFYNQFLLDINDIPYQKFLYKENLDRGNKTVEGVIKTLIYGVRSVAAQSEAGISKLCELIQDDLPHIASLLKKKRYVDDIAKSLPDPEERLKTIQDLDHALGLLSMKVKGYTLSGEDPHEKSSKDGVSVTVIGYRWFPKIDTFSINLQALHFGKKVRGRLDPTTEFFGEGGSMKSMEDFVPKSLTRRMVTSKTAAVFDPLGKVAPYMSKPKLLLRRTIETNPNWDDPIPADLREEWIKVFDDFEYLRGLYFQRPRIPLNAAEPLLVRLFAGADAGGDSMVTGIWIGVKLKGEGWSCKHLIGKTLLPIKSWTIPMRELHALWMASTLLNITVNLLDDFLVGKLVKRYVFGDSRIALAWTIYESTRLLPFHRHRVTVINKTVTEEEKFHCPGQNNPADAGTKVKEVDTTLVGPDSTWENGENWMTWENHRISDVLMSVQQIILDDSQQKIVKEAQIAPKFETEIKGFTVQTSKSEIEKYEARMKTSPYMEILPPQKFSHRFTVRVYAYVLRFIKRMKEAADQRRQKNGLEPRREFSIQKSRVKEYTIFHTDIHLGDELSDVGGALANHYGSIQVVVGAAKNYASSSNKKRFPDQPESWRPKDQPRYFPFECKEKEIQLSSTDLSTALACIFTWTSNEVTQFNDKGWIKKNCEWKEGILIRMGRIVEDHEIKVVGGAQKFINIGQLTGINLCVPVLDRYSPWAVNFANYIHCNLKVSKHRAALTCYRASLSHVYIIKGHSLFKQIVSDCTLCARLRRKFYERIMGSPHQLQLTISPLFYTTMVDLVGPYLTYVPGFERETRNIKSKMYKIHIAMFVCLGTGCINLQIVESQSTTGLMEAVCRFSMESGTPAVIFPDKQSGLEALLKSVSVTLKDMEGQLYQEHGIEFHTCPAQAHWQHGKIERTARVVRESIERAEFTKQRLHVLGWQTIAKSIEGVINDTPIGYISRKNASTAETLEVLCPNTFKFGRLNLRSPQAPFKVPDTDLRDYTEKVQQLWETWWRVWQDYYVEQLFEQPKWFEQGEEVSIGDIVMFKKESSDFGRHFSLGKIDEISTSHDGEIRNVWIRYKNLTENNSRRVERDIKTIFKIISIEDTSLHSMLELAWKLAEDLRKKELYVTPNPEDKSTDKPDTGIDDISDKTPDAGIDDISDKTPDAGSDDISDKPDTGSDDITNKKPVPKKRLTEVERLKQWSVNIAHQIKCSSEGDQMTFMSVLFPDVGWNCYSETCQVPVSSSNPLSSSQQL